LDGKLDEPFWKSARPVDLRTREGDDAEWPAMALMQYDGQFLYFAATCRRPAPASADELVNEKAPRDADLSAQDRIELLIDVDRDYTTYDRLVVSSSGAIADRCWEDYSWSPGWFVATDRTETTWTVEAAIPLAELTSTLPETKHVWAVGAQRVVPNVGFQSWTQPAGTKIVPEGFGLLVFE
jgi:hypothetical protein